MATAAECAAYAADLAALRAARLKMLSGGAIRSVTSSSGKRLEFQPTSMRDLDREIARLQALVDTCAGRCGGRRAIGIIPVTR